jgi:hypothetical protein
MMAGANCSIARIGGWSPRFDNVQISRRWGQGRQLSIATEEGMSDPALGRAKRTRDWLRVELEHFEQQLEREDTKALRRRIVLIRGLYIETQGKVKQLERNARAVFGSTAGNVPSSARNS